MQGLLQMPRLSVGLGVVTLVFAVGCSSLAEKERYLKLQRSVEQYASAIRWGRYETAAQFIARKDSQPGIIDAERFEEIRVTGYEAATGQLTSESEKASITVTFTYYDTSSGRVQSLADLQHWWYNDSLSRWFLDGNLPSFVRETTDAVPR